jgi:hypothetical protein
MHADQTSIAASTARPDGAPALTAIAPLAHPGTRDATPAARESLEPPIVGAGADERALSVRYELDVMTHRWVASIVDDDSGEIVRSVPSKQVLHQLAALRRPPLDLHA